MELLLQLIITGIASGSIYLLFGISFSIILAVTRTFHFAHGATFVVGAYSAYFLQQLGIPLFLAAFGGVLGAVFFGALAIEGILYCFLRKSLAILWSSSSLRWGL